MKITLAVPQATYVIRSYGPGQVVVNQQTYTRTLVVMPNEILTDWPPDCFDTLRAEHFAALTQYAFDVLLLGTGKRLRFPERSLLSPIEARGIGVEVMDTGAACRTYDLLLAEQRSVAAVLLMI